jgi:hypothetical protein
MILNKIHENLNITFKKSNNHILIKSYHKNENKTFLNIFSFLK